MNDVCPGCGRNEIHKMCPAWGTKYYMSGILFTKELEEQTKEERQAALKRSSDAEHERLSQRVSELNQRFHEDLKYRKTPLDDTDCKNE